MVGALEGTANVHQLTSHARAPWQGHRGTSAINGQTFIRGAPEDFATWAAWGNTEWSYERVLPYLNKAPYGRTLQHQPLYQGPARCALEAYVPRLITCPSS